MVSLIISGVILKLAAFDVAVSNTWIEKSLFAKYWGGFELFFAHSTKNVIVLQDASLGTSTLIESGFTTLVHPLFSLSRKGTSTFTFSKL